MHSFRDPLLGLLALRIVRTMGMARISGSGLVGIVFLDGKNGIRSRE